MNLPAHSIPPEVFDDLAEGKGTSDGLRRLVTAQHSKHALLLRQVVDSARRTGHDQADLARQGYDLLADIQVSHPDAVDAVAFHPPVGAWAAHTIRSVTDPAQRESAAPGQLAALAVAATARAGGSCSTGVPVINDSVMLPSLGRITVPGQSSGRLVDVIVKDSMIELTGDRWTTQVDASLPGDEPGWQSLRGLSCAAGDLKLSVQVEDLDEYRIPGSANLGGRLSAADLDRWQTTLAAGWQLLVSDHQEIAADVAAIARAFTPLQAPPGGQVSATSRETFGTVALSEPGDGCWLAVTLAHEIQHAKLSALIDIVPMTRPDDGSLHYAPWREDPRPIAGLLQGAYAFLGVAAFWRRQREAESGDSALRAHADYAHWRASVDQVLDILAGCGRLTPAGSVFVAGMTRTLRSWDNDAVPAAAADLARTAAQQHRSQWRQRNASAVT